MWHELISSLPSDPTLRKKTLEVVYKAVTNLITPVIQTGWNTAAKQVEDQKQFVKENVAKLLDTILSKEEELKAKMSEAVLKAIAPIKIEFSEKVSSLLQECGSPIVAIYSTIMEQRSIIYTEIEEALINNQPEKLDKVKHNVKELKDAVYNKLDSQIQGTIKNITGKDVNVSVKALASLFGPFKDLQHVIKSFFNFITPEHQFYVYKELLQHKKKIMDSPRADVESLLDREEYDTQWAIWWSHWSMYSDGWWFVWELSNYADLGSSRYALYQLAWDLVKISKKSLKKFYIKFGDELHEKAKTATDATYAATVQASFLIGYQKSLKFIKKHIKNLIRKTIINFFFFADAIKDTLFKEIVLPGAKLILDPLNSILVDPLDKLLDLEGMLTEFFL